MNLKELLSYQLYTSETVIISVYNLIIALLVVVVTFLAVYLLKKIFNRFARSGKLDQGTAYSFYMITKYLIWVNVLVLIIDSFGVEITVLLTGIAALLVGVGLGLQQLFNDIASGFVLLIERSLKVADVIELDNGTVGKVEEIGIRTSKLKTRDDIVLIIPNSKLVNDKVINWSHSTSKTRFHVSVGVAYGSDVDKVSEIMQQCAVQEQLVSETPDPFVRFTEFGSSALEFDLYFWLNDPFVSLDAKSALRFSINKVFTENNIRIPFPQMDVHIASSQT